MLTVKFKSTNNKDKSAGPEKSRKENAKMVRILNRREQRRTLGRRAREEEEEEVEEVPRKTIRGSRRPISSRREREEEEEEEPRRLGRGMGRVAKVYDFADLVEGLADFDPEGKNKYATLPPNFREAMARLAYAIDNMDEESQEAIAEAWEEAETPEE